MEEYLIKKSDELKADDTYIGDGAVVVVKNKLGNVLLRGFKNMSLNLMSNVPYDKGEEYELPDTVETRGYGKLEYIFDDNYSFDYKLISLFYKSFGIAQAYIQWFSYGDDKKAPMIKFFDYNKNFIGGIASILDK